MCFVFIWEQTATCATYSINWLVFITEMKSVYCAVRTGSLNKAVCPSYLKGWLWRYQGLRRNTRESDIKEWRNYTAEGKWIPKVTETGCKCNFTARLTVVRTVTTLTCFHKTRVLSYQMVYVTVAYMSRPATKGVTEFREYLNVAVLILCPFVDRQWFGICWRFFHTAFRSSIDDNITDSCTGIWQWVC